MSKTQSMKSRRKKGGRLQRLTSNVFAMFNQAQIQEFKVPVSLFSFCYGKNESIEHICKHCLNHNMLMVT